MDTCIHAIFLNPIVITTIVTLSFGKNVLRFLVLMSTVLTRDHSMSFMIDIWCIRREVWQYYHRQLLCLVAGCLNSCRGDVADNGDDRDVCEGLVSCLQLIQHVVLMAFKHLLPPVICFCLSFFFSSYFPFLFQGNCCLCTSTVSCLECKNGVFNVPFHVDEMLIWRSLSLQRSCFVAVQTKNLRVVRGIPHK